MARLPFQRDLKCTQRTGTSATICVIKRGTNCDMHPSSVPYPSPSHRYLSTFFGHAELNVSTHTADRLLLGINSLVHILSLSLVSKNLLKETNHDDTSIPEPIPLLCRSHHTETTVAQPVVALCIGAFGNAQVPSRMFTNCYCEISAN